MNAARVTATAVETSATAFWVGANAGFAFVSAPIAFALVHDRDVFAELTERSLSRLAAVTYVAGGTAAAVALGRAGFERQGRTNDVCRGIAAVSALLCINYHQRAIVPAMSRAQAALGSFTDVAENAPQRVAYRELHKRSTRTYGIALLLGIAGFVLATLRPNPDESSA